MSRGGHYRVFFGVLEHAGTKLLNILFVLEQAAPPRGWCEVGAVTEHFLAENRFARTNCRSPTPMDDLSIIGPEWPGEARDERLEHEDQDV